MIEVRTARHSQHLPVFLRMLDKDSVWGYDNGKIIFGECWYSMKQNYLSGLYPPLLELPPLITV